MLSRPEIHKSATENGTNALRAAAKSATMEAPPARLQRSLMNPISKLLAKLGRARNRREDSPNDRSEPFDAQRKLSLLLGSMPVNLWATDHDLKITFNQGGGLEALGYRTSEHVGAKLTDVLGTNDPDFLPLLASMAALRGKSSQYELEWNGRYLEARVEPLVGPGGKIYGTVGLAIDVTERRHLDEALRTQAGYFQELFESAPVAIVILDENDQVLRLNNEFTRIFGYEAEEAVGRRINDLIVPEELQREGLELTAKVASGATLNQESLRRRKDGTTL